ncbi:MAG: DnaJ domain-containing protein [Cyanobacteria bacterium REEB459]|nr:DnaJ domain-containing protein [Cyanobacteria bacterium REEB459]
MELNQGLFKLDFKDHHAVLGLPLSADPRAVRKRYLTIARLLHPDSQTAAAAGQAQQASDLLSRWVNPAYEVLSQERLATEHRVMLKLRGQVLHRADTPPALLSATAQQLLKVPQLENAYRQAVNTIALTQYNQLEQVADLVGQLSELNLVYLYRTSDDEPGAAPAPTTTVVPAGASPPAAPVYRQTQAMILASYLNRAREFERDRNYDRAILETREALKTYPNQAQCHSYLASLYLKTGQLTLARVHARRSLEINPNDDIARAVQAQLQATDPKSQPGAPNPKSPRPGSGNFFGLFGKGKK